MKKLSLLLVLTMLLALLAGCGQKTPEITEPEQNVEPEPVETPLVFETLRVEFGKGNLTASRLAEVVRELPEPLQTALAEQGVTVKEVKITIGPSTAATVQALEEGTVDLAFLPAENLASYGTAIPVLLTSGPLFWDQGEDLAAWRREPVEAPLVPGYRSLICAAPTEYGRNLAGRTELSWTEVDHARWGVLDADSIPGYRAVNLWLADNYEGNTLEDLSDVTVYDSFSDLILAASNGEIDLFPMDECEREDWAERWTTPAVLNKEQEEQGLGHENTIWEDLPAVALTDWFYDMAAAAAPDRADLTDSRFAAALEAAVRALDSSAVYDRDAHLLAQDVFGRECYGVAPEGALDATRRLLTLEGKLGA